jgi:hypothetical protein
MFDWGHINFKAKLGWLNWMTHILNSVAAAGVLAWIVSSVPATAAAACQHQQHTHSCALQLSC